MIAPHFPPDPTKAFFPSATFQPWVGDKYESEGLKGLRLLIVGDCHYDFIPIDPASLSQLTSGVLANAISQDGGSLLFFHRVGDTVAGHKLNVRDARNEFWQRVAFCNFFQRVFDRSDEKPTREDAELAVPVFREILEGLKPHAVLVTSARVWDSMKPGLSVVRTEDSPCETRLWTEAGKSMIAMRTVHPSLYRVPRDERFTAPVWQGRVARFMSEARDWARDNPR